MANKKKKKSLDQKADAVMLEIWKQFHQFYDSHFRAVGIGLSAADQVAFYEIAQPLLRDLARGRGT